MIRALFLCLLLSTGSAALAQPAAENASQHASRVFDSLASQPARLRMLLREFPKGADLHNHLSGAIYAESYIGWARQGGLCLDPGTHALGPAHCHAPMVPADNALAHVAGLNDGEIDALSMRNFAPNPSDRSGHDHFFSTFGKFDAAAKGRAGDMLAEAANRAAADHVLYLEIMHYPLMRESAVLGVAHPWHGDDFARDLDEIRPGLPALVREARVRTDQTEARMRTVLHCGSPQAQPGCRVRIRYLTQVLRAMPPAAVFSQMAYSYALVTGDPRFLGVNIVEPEDDPVALRDYDLHMRAFRYLSSLYPSVPLTLHAGELAEGLVPTADLQFHIRHAVEIAGAKRIGHGVDVTYEDDAPGLLAEMARRHVAVEINLTSNAQILGVSGDEHPFNAYRAAGVPLVLSTDDEGVERIDLTHEYLRATTTYHLHYADLKQFSRNSLIYSFLPGASLWNISDGHLIGACASTVPGASPSGGCADFLAHDEKARVQWQLEAAFASFEQNLTRQRF